MNQTLPTDGDSMFASLPRLALTMLLVYIFLGSSAAGAEDTMFLAQADPFPAAPTTPALTPRFLPARPPATAKHIEPASPDPLHWKRTDRNCLVYDPVPGPDESVSWTGGCAGGKASGSGTEVWTVRGSTDTVYEGMMQAGKMDGDGTLTFYHSDGTTSRYRGMFHNDFESGFGVKDFRNGGQYVGQWAQDLPNGPGTFQAHDGKTVGGFWKDGCLDGGPQWAMLRGDQACP